MKCQIMHWDDSKKKTTPLVFEGQPEPTVVRYVQFLDDLGTAVIKERLMEIWARLP